jgi:hypothetical protein
MAAMRQRGLVFALARIECLSSQAFSCFDRFVILQHAFKTFVFLTSVSIPPGKSQALPDRPVSKF